MNEIWAFIGAVMIVLMICMLVVAVSDLTTTTKKEIKRLRDLEDAVWHMRKQVAKLEKTSEADDDDAA